MSPSEALPDPEESSESDELSESERDFMDRLDTAIQSGTDEESIRAIDSLLLERASFGSQYLAPLCSASTRATTAVLEHLFNRGATIEADTFLGESPLHFVASNGRVDMMICLLEHASEADLHRFDEAFGMTALGVAVRDGHEQIARLLLEAGTRVDFCLHSHAVDPPLRDAVESGRTDLVEFLLKYGANPDQRGWMWITPRDAATKMKDTHPEIFAMIDRIPRTESPV